MKNIIPILFGTLLCLYNQSALADPTPTPMVVYKHQGGYLTQSDAKQMQLFIKQLQDVIVAGDPSPQPSINHNLVTERLTKHTVNDLINAGFYIEKRSTCELIDEAFRDRHGHLLKPEIQAEKAIACGCEMIDAGYGIPEAQITANNVFHRNYQCVNF